MSALPVSAEADATSWHCPSKVSCLPPRTHPSSTQDFYLDILFNPVWMSGPHVFSFNKDGTVVRPKTCHSEPYPGYYAHKSSHRTYDISGKPYHIGVKSLTPGADGARRHNSADSRCYADAATSSISRGFCLEQKPWKNVAITEEDEVAFEAIQMKKPVSGLKGVRKVEEANLVYTWPPTSYSRLNPIEDVPECCHDDMDENEVPQLSYASSADTSDVEELSIPPLDEREGRVPFQVLEEQPLEKIIGFQRLRPKAPPSLSLELKSDADDCLFKIDVASNVPSLDGQLLSPLWSSPSCFSGNALPGGLIDMIPL